MICQPTYLDLSLITLCSCDAANEGNKSSMDRQHLNMLSVIASPRRTSHYDRHHSIQYRCNEMTQIEYDSWPTTSLPSADASKEPPRSCSICHKTNERHCTNYPRSHPKSLIPHITQHTVRARPSCPLQYIDVNILLPLKSHIPPL